MRLPKIKISPFWYVQYREDEGRAIPPVYGFVYHDYNRCTTHFCWIPFNHVVRGWLWLYERMRWPHYRLMSEELGGLRDEVERYKSREDYAAQKLSDKNNKISELKRRLDR